MCVYAYHVSSQFCLIDKIINIIDSYAGTHGHAHADTHTHSHIKAPTQTRTLITPLGGFSSWLSKLIYSAVGGFSAHLHSMSSWDVYARCAAADDDDNGGGWMEWKPFQFLLSMCRWSFLISHWPQFIRIFSKKIKPSESRRFQIDILFIFFFFNLGLFV